MKLESHPQELTQVPFSKTECGVDFNINTDTHERLRGVLMEYPSFKTNFFELFFFRKASGWLRYGFQHIVLKDNTVLILSPHIHQEWHIDESQTDYRFLIFHDDFLSTYLNPTKRNVLDLKNETCKNREKRNVLKISHTRHFKTTKKQSKTGCFYSF